MKQRRDTRLQLVQRTAALGALVIASWCVMTTTHELGHVVGGWCGGGHLQQLELRPWKLPHSLFEPDPRPLLTLWAGPVLGVILPLGFAVVWQRRWSWFVAHFCVLANGVYLLVAWFTGDQHLDTARLLANGASPWSVAIFCAAVIGVGYPRFRNACIRVWRDASAAEPTRIRG